jgi:uncharacterized protein
MKRQINLLLGFLFLGIGILGAVLPVLPSTCFFITAAYYFGTSSEKLENWMLNHPRIGPTIISWRKYKAIPRLGKIMACVAMSVSVVIMVLSAAPLFVKIGCIVALILSAVYVLTRPTLEVLLADKTF